MIPFELDKTRALEIFEDLIMGRAIEPAADGHSWTGQELIAVAGGALALAMLAGSRAWYLREASDGQHAELNELVAESLEGDIHAAIALYAALLRRCVTNDAWDQVDDDGPYGVLWNATARAEF